MRIHPLVLCGGTGARLWPLSRGDRAKQFAAIVENKDLLTHTLERVSSSFFEKILLVCEANHYRQVQANPLAHNATVFVEPAPRGTAAAIAMVLAYFEVAQSSAHLDYRPPADADPTDKGLSGPSHQDPPTPHLNDIFLVLPSDHIIHDEEAFHAAIRQGAALALQGWIVCLGVTPDRPETGYGYITRGPPLSDHAFVAHRFLEKPKVDVAEQLIASGTSCWNAGILLFQSSRMRQAMGQSCPQIYAAAQAPVARREGQYVHFQTDEFAALPPLSIDHAVMEHAPRIAVIPVDMGWSDLGSWSAVYAASPKTDENGNAASGDVLVHGGARNLIRADGKRISLIGVDDLAVIVDGDDILILPLARSQEARIAEQARETR